MISPDGVTLSNAPRKTVEQLTEDIPAMPAVAMRAMHELGDPNTTAKKVAEIISVDQAITSRLLRIANSPVFGARRKIGAVNDAVVLIGFSAMKGLIVTVSTRGVYKRAGLMEQLLWEHSVGCAVACHTLAGCTGVWTQDEAFVGGLMHDIGRGILANVYREDYELFFKHIYNNKLSRLDLIDLEQRNLGVTHMEIGKAVIQKWRLSPCMEEVVAFHHAASVSEIESCEFPDAIAITALGDLICRHLAIGLREADLTAAVYDSPMAGYLDLTSDKLAEVVETTLETFEVERATFED